MPRSSSPDGSETAKKSVTIDNRVEEISQNPKESAQNKAALTTQDDTQSNYDPSKQSTGIVEPQKHEDDTWSWLSMLKWFFSLGLLGAIGFYLNWLEKRPHLLAEWEMEELKDGREIPITLTLRNIGQIPATLYARALLCDLVQQVPAKFDYLPRLETGIRGTELRGGDPIKWYLTTPHIGAQAISRIEKRRTPHEVIYAAAYIEFGLSRWQKRQVIFEAICDEKKKIRPVRESDRRGDDDAKGRDRTERAK